MCVYAYARSVGSRKDRQHGSSGTAGHSTPGRLIHDVLSENFKQAAARVRGPVLFSASVVCNNPAGRLFSLSKSVFGLSPRGQYPLLRVSAAPTRGTLTQLHNPSRFRREGAVPLFAGVACPDLAGSAFSRWPSARDLYRFQRASSEPTLRGARFSASSHAVTRMRGACTPVHEGRLYRPLGTRIQKNFVVCARGACTLSRGRVCTDPAGRPESRRLSTRGLYPPP